MNNRISRIKKGGQARFDNKLRLLSGLLCFTLYFPAVNADMMLHQGLNPLGTTTVNIVGQNGSNPEKPDWDGLAFTIGRNQVSSQCKSPNQALPHSIVDGYSGILLATGVLFVIYDGTLSGERGTTAGTLNYSYSWDSMGILMPATGTEAPWCVDPRVSLSGGRSVSLAPPNGWTTGSFETGIYVSSGITSATVSVPELYVTRGYANSAAGQAGTFIGTSGKTYTIVSDCTVSTPATVSFGNIDAGSTDSVISPDEGMGVSCEGALTTVNITYSVQPISQTLTTSTLAMTNSQGTTLGAVRGFIGTNADTDAGCNDTATSIHFGASATNLLTAAANNTSHTLPLKWVLCPSSSAVPGQGTASATLDIIWQ